MNSRAAFAILLFTLGVLSANAGQLAGTDPPASSHAQTSTQHRKAGASESSSAKKDAAVAARGDAAGAVHGGPQRAQTARHTKAEDLLSAAVIADAQLANARGGTETSTNNSNGLVSGNMASQLTTGSNSISQDSFASSSGIPIVIQNTGNNVLIQNSTILNLQLTNPQ